MSSPDTNRTPPSGSGPATARRVISGFAGIYRALGLLTKGHLVEVDRAELVAGYPRLRSYQSPAYLRSPGNSGCFAATSATGPLTSASYITIPCRNIS